MDDSTLSRDVFPFFHLPRELRDEIYNNLLETIGGTLANGLRFKASNTSNPDLCTISRQFHTEYRDRAQRHALLTLSDGSTFKADRTSVSLPEAALSIPRLQINLFCAPPFITLDHHRQWLGPVTALMPQVRSVGIKVVTHHDTRAASVEATLLGDGFWTETKAPRTLEVYRALQGSNALDFDLQDDLVMWWDGAKGGFQRVGQSEHAE